MPKTPAGAKRPADVTKNAVLVMKIATGEAKEDTDHPTVAQTNGKRGGETRARKLSAKERKAIAAKGAKTRWGKGPALRGEKARS